MMRDEALALLQTVKCSPNVIEHCIAVSEKALSIAERAERHTSVDKELTAMGGLLHDIGRAVTHGIDHGVVGAELLNEKGISRDFQLICERHVCAGIPRPVAEAIGLPPRDFIPVSLEEKIVCHADNLTNHTVEELRRGWMDFFGSKNGKIIVALLDDLHEELVPYL
jgi:uncharacterized protein